MRVVIGLSAIALVTTGSCALAQDTMVTDRPRETAEAKAPDARPPFPNESNATPSPGETTGTTAARSSTPSGAEIGAASGTLR